MKIEVWSDFACPFCYLGKRYLEEALASFSGEVEVVFRAFELDPHAPGESEEPTLSRLMRKYQQSETEAANLIARVEQMGQEAGMALRYAESRYTRTFEAHRLAKFAESQGKGNAMVERLFYAYFCENQQLAKRTALIELALTLDLDRDDVAQLLTGDDFGHEVREDERMAKRLGIQAVPHFLIDGKIAVSGARSRADWLALFHHLSTSP